MPNPNKIARVDLNSVLFWTAQVYDRACSKNDDVTARGAKAPRRQKFARSFHHRARLEYTSLIQASGAKGRRLQYVSLLSKRGFESG